jgi:hypothetical protein
VSHPKLWPDERFKVLLAFYNRDQGLDPDVAARLLVLSVDEVEKEIGFLRRDGLLTALDPARGLFRINDAGVAALRLSGRLTTNRLDYDGKEMVDA